MSHGGEMYRWIVAALTFSAAVAQTKLLELRSIPDSKPDLGRAFQDYWRRQANTPVILSTRPQGDVKCSVPLIEAEIPGNTRFAMRTIQPKPVDSTAVIEPPAPPCPQLKK